MGKAPDRKKWYKANKKPVGLGRAVEIRENNERKREVKLVKVGEDPRIGTGRYNVYIKRKNPLK